MSEDKLRENIIHKFKGLLWERDGWEALAHFGLAMVQQERDDPKNALKSINEALKNVPVERSADFHHLKAEILLDLDKPKKALSSLNQCINLEKKYSKAESISGTSGQKPSSFMLKGDVYHQLEKYRLAIECNLKAVQLFKKQKIIKDARDSTLSEVLYSIGHLYIHLKKYKESLKWLRLAEKQKPHEDMSAIYFDQADALVHLKKYEEALKSARKAVDDDRADGDFWLMYAYCLALNKKESYNVLRSFNFSILLTTSGLDPDHKDWPKKVDTVTRYLKNADEEKMAKFLIKRVKPSIQEISLRRRGSKKK